MTSHDTKPCRKCGHDLGAHDMPGDGPEPTPNPSTWPPFVCKADGCACRITPHD